MRVTLSGKIAFCTSFSAVSFLILRHIRVPPLLELSGEGSHRFGSIVAHNPQSLKWLWAHANNIIDYFLSKLGTL